MCNVCAVDRRGGRSNPSIAGAVRAPRSQLQPTASTRQQTRAAGARPPWRRADRSPRTRWSAQSPHAQDLAHSCTSLALSQRATSKSVHLYTGWNDVTASMVTIRSSFCGYNLVYVCGVNWWRFTMLFKYNLIAWFKENAHMVINLPTKRIYVTSEQEAFLRVLFLQTRWRRKPAGIDMERNYVSVILCIRRRRDRLGRTGLIITQAVRHFAITTSGNGGWQRLPSCLIGK